jgi:hypothetical protein
MSKQIKLMQMDALKATFHEVRDLVVVDITGLDSIADNHLVHGLGGREPCGTQPHA